MMTLGDLKTYLATGTVNQSLLGAGSMVGKMVHWVVTDILNAADFWWNQGEDTFATVANQAEYFLSNRVALNKIWGMVDETNDRRLYPTDRQLLYDYDPTPTETGDAGWWSYVGQAACQAVPTVAGVLSIVSSSSTDVSLTVLIKGKSAGIEQYESLTLNGTTTVTGTVAWDANTPLQINLNTAARGLVTATRGAVTVAQIPPGHLRVLRPHIRLSLVPDAVATIRYFFYKRSVPLVSDAELVDLPDAAFTTLRYGLEEIGYFLTGKLKASADAFQKRQIARKELINWSERDVAGNPIKNVRPSDPFAFQLPRLIEGSVS